MLFYLIARNEMGTRNNTERDHGYEQSLERVAQLLDALMNDDIEPGLRKKIQAWFVGNMSEHEKYTALEKLFMELEPNLAPDSYEYDQLRKTCRMLGLGRRRRVPLRDVAMRVAAVVVSVFAMAGIAWLWNDMRPQKLVANVSVSTPEGVTKRIVLPDGSQVWLDGATTICYNEDFADGRSVTLDGRAAFRVERDTLSPFRVDAGEMVVEVLGTDFIVRSRSDEPLSEVVLASGSVRVAPSGGGFVELSPNERLTYDVQHNEAIIEVVETDNIPQWIVNLRMNDVPLKEALRRIASYYGLEVKIIGDRGREDLVNLDLDEGLPLSQVLDVVSAISGGFGYEITDSEIVVTLN